MRLFRSLVVGGCAAALSFVGGCYRPTEKAEEKRPKAAVAVVPDIKDDADSKTFQRVTVASIQEEARRKAALAAANSLKPTGTPTPSATVPVASATAGPALGPVPTASASATGDRYLRPAMQRALPTASAEARSPRSPVRPSKPGVPPPRTRVLAAPETSGGALGVTFDNLMFEMKPTDYFSPTMLTDAVRALFEKKIKIRGYIHPASMLVEKGAKRFVLVRDDQGCCFGPGALLYDNIIVDMVPGKTTNFSVRPIAVEGVLTYREYRDLGDRPTSIFHLEADSVE
ncbi:MAG: hypothetical protein K8U03_26950 [Planctomycetia bacterium]|nr:hypothetical protein [Planctomycetia bacterium]